METHSTCWIRAMGFIYGGVQHWLERGDGIDSGGMQQWLDRGDGIDLLGCAMRACSTGWIRAIALIYGDASWGCATGSGDGIDWCCCAMGARWIREMGLIHGGMRHWLDWGDGIDSGGHAMGPCDTGWIGTMGLIHGGARPWLDRGNGFDWWGFATLAGPGRWDWFMGVCDTGWNGAMALIYGDASWGCATGSGRWDWFVGARHGGATLAEMGQWHWFMGTRHGGARLDQGDGSRAGMKGGRGEEGVGGIG